jgi:hypothetical protein
MVAQLNSQLIGLAQPLIAEPSRMFVKEAMMVFVEDGGAPVDAWFHRRYLIAFNDLLVVAKAKTDSHGRRQVVEELPMADLRVAATTSSGTNTRVLVVSCASRRAILAFAAPSNDETDAWADLLKSCVHAIGQKRLSFSRQ